MFNGLTLLVPEKSDPERDSVCLHWSNFGGRVLRLGRFWDPPQLDSNVVRLYGPETFCLVLEQQLKLKLISPADELMSRFSSVDLKREFNQISLASAFDLEFPYFVKPVAPKIFRANVYASAEDLRAECKGLEIDTPVFCSEPVEILAEARFFVLDGNIVASSVYEGDGSLTDAATEVAHLLPRIPSAPRTYVADTALISGRGWAILEFNSTWGAGLNGCEPAAVANCLVYATASQ